jgi:hypothetical protein
MKSDKYLVCKFFTGHYEKIYIYGEKLGLIQYKEQEKFTTILGCDIPTYFINKIEEINIILGQQQLESLDQIIGIIKSKNSQDKIETLKKSNLQKSIAWCEKYKIPHNKFTEKVNIFVNGPL